MFIIWPELIAIYTNLAEGVPKILKDLFIRCDRNTAWRHAENRFKAFEAFKCKGLFDFCEENIRIIKTTYYVVKIPLGAPNQL